MSDIYDDIIALPHHVSPTRAQMPCADRAAQFSPFAALTGFGAAITETGRLTEQRIELDESAKAALDERLGDIQVQLESRPLVTITYFKPDENKAGGAYIPLTDAVKKINKYEHVVVMSGGARIPINDIVDIEFLQ